MFILGTKVHNISLINALKKAESFFYDGSQHYIVTPNPEIILKAARDISYRKILNKADLSIPDGVGVIWASKKLYAKPIKERIAGVDFMMEFLSYLAHKSYPTYMTERTYKILFLGGKNGVAKNSADIFKEKFSHLDFCGIANADNTDLEFIIKDIIQPDCIFVALGAPKQEQWISQNLAKFPSIKIAMGVGGAFDMTSGRTARAPNVLRKNGGEWLWRLIIQPSRICRIFNAVLVFPFLVSKEKFIHSFHR